MRKIEQTKGFERKHKKLKKNDKAAINEVIQDIVKKPESGVPKKGDLSGYLTVSYRSHGGQCRLVYCYNYESVTLVDFGPRENFYR
jgi:mRNA-degrading endonuclease RelE of RelBE toxin-antitoxin system